jgi:hypothetical protein
LLAVGVAGVALTTTLVVPAAEVQPFTVTVTGISSRIGSRQHSPAVGFWRLTR